MVEIFRTIASGCICVVLSSLEVILFVKNRCTGKTKLIHTFAIPGRDQNWKNSQFSFVRFAALTGHLFHQNHLIVTMLWPKEVWYYILSHLNLNHPRPLSVWCVFVFLSVCGEYVWGSYQLVELCPGLDLTSSWSGSGATSWRRLPAHQTNRTHRTLPSEHRLGKYRRCEFWRTLLIFSHGWGGSSPYPRHQIGSINIQS